ncbi:BF3164 family lipoprotein [Bacteroides helcogenes]|uniref:Lipoprotein n=1 Tax=Bacteroides helcogenes (strain ATCC 35417 / DSM 20613 / JCM 6297 / CCUG 15421 / P 36-108) TaxID=693979 RepID=E6SUI4_BACT6|nr:BF3164 family lipoprotein [Bacteroides helcogenes]ADV43348.1 hypothetical protein Bache_1342 [Bacteroides helcogenes P 36-108]MDY5238116.1 BF3164 family lipoprotein [Bacteroides helcogenes]
MKKQLLLCCIFSLLVSCTLSKKERDGSRVVNLEATLLSVDTAILGSKLAVLSSDILLLSTVNHSPVYDVCRIRKDSIIKIGSFMSIGEGPYEMNLSTCFISEESNNLYVYSQDYRKMFVIPFPLSENLLNTDNWEELKVPSVKNCFWSYGYSAIQIVSDSSFLSVGGSYEDANVLSLIQVGKSVEKVNGFSYPENESDIPNIVKRQVYNESHLVKRPFVNQYAIVGDRADYLGIFNFENKQVVNLHFVKKNFPKYVAMQDGMNVSYDPENSNGYRANATSHFIYLLSSPFKTMNEWGNAIDYKGYPSSYRDRIEVYDWDGNYVKTFVLNMPVGSFNVSENDSIILANTMLLDEEKECIVKFAIP